MHTVNEIVDKHANEILSGSLEHFEADIFRYECKWGNRDWQSLADALTVADYDSLMHRFVHYAAKLLSTAPNSAEYRSRMLGLAGLRFSNTVAHGARLCSRYLTEEAMSKTKTA
ncbi:MAG: hypothetical protein AABY01_01435 [Nanoarchaeota archaeon]